MASFKRYLLLLLPIFTGFASCSDTANTGSIPAETEFKTPVSQPLVLTKPQKINWDDDNAIRVRPVVKHFDLFNIPAQFYDTAGFKPFKYPVEEAHLDFNSLPKKDLDIDGLPSGSLNFKTEKLSQPKLIHAGLPYLKNLNLSLYELGEAQGLQGQVISCQFNDHDGFLWIATNKGLYRYDGENLLQYLSGNWPFSDFILNMLQDSFGRIWMGTSRAGLFVLDPKAATLARTNRSLGLSSDTTGRMVQDVQQRIWLSSPKGINIIDPKQKTIQLLNNNNGLADTSTENGILQDSQQRIWIGGKRGGVNIIDLKNKKIEYIDKATGSNSDPANRMLLDRSGRVLLVLDGGVINILDAKNNTIQTIKEARHPKADAWGLLLDNQGKVWIGNVNNGGATIIDLEKHLYKKLTRKNGLNSNIIIAITQDKQDHVWIGTSAGLNMIAENKAVIERIGKGQVNFMTTDKEGLIWDNLVNDGIDIIDRSNKTTRHLGARQGLSNDTASQCSVIGNKIYASTNSGLNIIDVAQKTITILGKEQGLGSKIVHTVLLDKAGRIWMSGNGGFSLYDPRTKTIKHMAKGQSLNTGVLFSKANTDGKFWCYISGGGTAIIDPESSTVQYLVTNVPILKDQSPRFFSPDERGNIWIGTDKGVYIADMKNKNLISFSVQQGLIDEHTATIIRHNKQMYVSTVRGITVITPPEEGLATNIKWAVRSFGKEYELNKINPAYYQTDAITPEGNFLWGDYGLTVLNLAKADSVTQAVYISGLNVMDEPGNFSNRENPLSQGISWDGVVGPSNLPVNLELPHDRNYLQFFYSALNFSPRDTTWYSYRLVGVDTGWSNKSAVMNSRNYFSLEPGKYTFEVVSKNSDSSWSKPASFSFVINHPWWKTWWAYFIYIFGFGGTIWAAVTYRSMQLIREKRVLERKIQVRTEEVIQQKEEIETQRDNLEAALGELKATQGQLIQSEKMASLGELTAGIAHEIQNPLNFVNNFSEVNTELIDEMLAEIEKGDYQEVEAIATDIKDNQQKISQHGKRADFIVKGMLQHSRTNTGERQLTDVNVLADEFFKLSYHGLRAKDKLFNATLICNFDEHLPKIDVVQQEIGRVMLNLFNNAFYAVQQRQKTAGVDFNPTVEVSTTAVDNRVEIRVRDNGTGIPQTVRDKILQPFFTTKPTGEGTGLGLSLSYDIVVKGHGGSIDIQSVEGEYSVFIVKLPYQIK